MDKVLALQAIKNAGISISPGTSKSALTFEMLKDIQWFLRAWRRDITLQSKETSDQTAYTSTTSQYSFYLSSYYLLVKCAWRFVIDIVSPNASIRGLEFFLVSCKSSRPMH
jgi:hypothetical protein